MDTTTTPTPIPIASTPPTSPPAETSTGPSGEGREGVFKLRAADFQSNEVPHYFLTSGRKWLVCIDGSTESKLGLFHALDLMNTNEDSIILVHAVKKSRSLASRLALWRGGSPPETQEQPASAPGGGEAVPAAGESEELEPEPDSVKRGKGYLAHAGNLVKQWTDEVKWSTRFIEAKDPREAICDLANEEKADYIVMGSRGQNPIKKMFMGSVSSYVSSHAPCPVIVIRETEEQRREKRAAELEEKRVLKKTSEKPEKKKKLRKKKRDQRMAEGQVQLQQELPAQAQPAMGGEEAMMIKSEFLPQPPIPPPVDPSLMMNQGPAVPGETTIPIMDK